MNVTQDFLDYQSGVYMSDDCTSKPALFQHTVLIIGYGSEQTDFGMTPFWVIQNSWGVGWGINGYAKVIRGKNQCNIADQTYIPSEVFDPNIDTVRPF